MTLDDVYDILKQTKLPVSYRQWAEGEVPDLPYILYYTDETDNFTADNRTYKKVSNVNIELYSNLKNLIEEEKIETLLDDNKIEWDAFERYIETEKMYEILYQITII